LGATCTIITNLYREQKVPLEKSVASILLCGILADILALQSAMTTETDIEATEYLSSITGLEIKSLRQNLQAPASQINTLSAKEIVVMDMKKYAEQDLSLIITGQIYCNHSSKPIQYTQSERASE